LHTVTTAVGALATVGALVSGCDGSVGIGGKLAVGKAALQTDIANRLAKAGEKPQSVTCKDDLIGEVGKTARCEVVIHSAAAVEFDNPAAVYSAMPLVEPLNVVTAGLADVPGFK